MKIEIVERQKTENLDLARFILEGVSTELANGLRRIILMDVPSMAINEVLFVENDGVLYDEMIAHRLGLIPLVSDLKNYMMPHECSCGGSGCSLCQVEFTLDVKAEGEEKIVYSKDLISRDPKIRPVKDDIIIAKLGKNTSMVFEAYAQLGLGKDHAKFQPVCSVGYKFFPEIKIDSSKYKNEAEMKEVANLCHAHVIEVANGKIKLVDEYWKACDICGNCKRNSPAGAVQVSWIPNKFLFTIEGTGLLPIQTILEKAVEIFIEKIDELDEKTNKAKLFVRPLHLR